MISWAVSYILEFIKIAQEDIEIHKKYVDQVVMKKFKTLRSEHPKTDTGLLEILKYVLPGLYSRRINEQHRLVYSIKEEIVTVKDVSASAHNSYKKF